MNRLPKECGGGQLQRLISCRKTVNCGRQGTAGCGGAAMQQPQKHGRGLLLSVLLAGRRILGCVLQQGAHNGCCSGAALCHAVLQAMKRGRQIAWDIETAGGLVYRRAVRFFAAASLGIWRTQYAGGTRSTAAKLKTHCLPGASSESATKDFPRVLRGVFQMTWSALPAGRRSGAPTSADSSPVLWTCSKKGMVNAI